MHENPNRRKFLEVTTVLHDCLCPRKTVSPVTCGPFAGVWHDPSVRLHNTSNFFTVGSWQLEQACDLHVVCGFCWHKLRVVSRSLGISEGLGLQRFRICEGNYALGSGVVWHAAKRGPFPSALGI
jgi:hypothetical protein